MTIKIVSFNICRARYSSIDKICGFISGLNADILFVQEIDRFMERSGNIDQFEEIKTECKFQSAFFNHTLSFGKDGQYGTAAFMRKNFGDVSTIDLPLKDDPEPRRCINLQLNADTNLILLHLSKYERLACKQVSTLMVTDYFQPTSILAGDFNIGSNLLRSQFAFEEQDKKLTWPNTQPEKRIDHIVSRAVKIYNRETINAVGISDHNAISAEIIL